MFVSQNFVLMLGIGNAATSLVAGVVMYILIEHPISRLVQWSSYKLVSHDYIMHQDFVMKGKLEKLNVSEHNESQEEDQNLDIPVHEY
jgi:hypothetical protein